MSVNIQGLNFRATPGSRREQILIRCQKALRRDTDWHVLFAVSLFVGGFFSGILTAWYLP